MAKRKYTSIALTYAERTVLVEMTNKAGFPLSNEMIEQQTGIKAALIPRIVYSLQGKGYPVHTSPRSGRHEYRKESWRGYAALVALSLIITSIFLIAFLQYLDEEPKSYHENTIRIGQ